MFPFENLEVYKKAFELNRKVYFLLKERKNIASYVRDQLGRASLSVMLNIAEGSGRYSNKDRRNFFVIARSSAFECSAIIDFLFSANEIEEQERIFFNEGLEEISRILFVMIKNLEKK